MLVHKLAQRILERMIRGFAIVKHTVKDIVIKALNTVKVGYFKSYLSPYPNHWIQKAFKKWTDVKQLDLYLASIVINLNLIVLIQITLRILNYLDIVVDVVDNLVTKSLAAIDNQTVIELVVKITMDFLVNLAAI